MSPVRLLFVWSSGDAFGNGLLRHGLLFRGRCRKRIWLMLMMGLLFSGSMVVSHESHHQQMRERAEQNHAVEQDIVERDSKDGNQHDPDHWN